MARILRDRHEGHRVARGCQASTGQVSTGQARRGPGQRAGAPRRGGLPDGPGHVGHRGLGAAALAVLPGAGGRADAARHRPDRLRARAAVHRLEEVHLRHRLREHHLGLVRPAGLLAAGAAPGADIRREPGLRRRGAARARDSHGRRALRADGAPRGVAMAGRAGGGAGAARRLPAQRRADDHAGRTVRDAARGRDRPAAVAAQARPVPGHPGRAGARHVGPGPPGGRGAHRAGADLRGAGRAGLAHQGAARRGHDLLLRAAGPGLHELLRGDPALRVRAVQHGQRVPVRAGGARRRLRHAEDPRQRAAAVPEPEGRRHPGRGRPGQRAGIAAGAVPAGQRLPGHPDRHPAAAEGDGLQRAEAAAAAGGGRHRQGLGEAVRA